MYHYCEEESAFHVSLQVKFSLKTSGEGGASDDFTDVYTDFNFVSSKFMLVL